MTSPTAAIEPGQPSPAAKFETLGVDGIKLFDELRMTHPELFGNDDLTGVPPGLGAAIDAFIERVAGNFETKKLTVVFDGIFLPMSLEEKSLTEDMVMAAAWHFMRLKHEVIFAPYLASSQLQILKENKHVSTIYMQNPPRVPTALVSWNNSPEGPQIANINKYVPNMLHVDAIQGYPPSTQLHMLEQSTHVAADVLAKVLDKYSAVDAVVQGNSPILFMLQFAGIISPKLARALANRTVENDNANMNLSASAAAASEESKAALADFMAVLLPLRAQIVHQLITDLQTIPQTIQLKWDDNAHNQTPPLIQLDNWHVSPAINKTNGPLRKPHMSFLEAWGVTDVLRFENAAVSYKEDVDIYSVVPTVILRALDLMGYFTHAQEEEVPQTQAESSSCSIYGEALKQFKDEPHLGDSAVLFIELVRTNAFNLMRLAPGAAATSSATADEGAATTKEASETAAAAGGDSKDADKPAEADGEQKKKTDEASGNNNAAIEDVAAKIISVIPVSTSLPVDKTKHYDIAAQAPFIRGAQAHTRSLRMLVEASAGNIVLRELTQNPEAMRNPASLASCSDVLSTMPAALPFTNTPSSRALNLFYAIKEFGSADAVAKHFGVNADVLATDVEDVRKFVTIASHARDSLAVRDEDVGLDPSVIEEIRPALSFAAGVLGIELPPMVEPAPVEQQASDVQAE